MEGKDDDDVSSGWRGVDVENPPKGEDVADEPRNN